MNHTEIDEFVAADRVAVKRGVTTSIHRHRVARRTTIAMGSVLIVSGVACVGWAYPEYLKPAIGGPILPAQSFVEPYRDCMQLEGWTPMDNPPKTRTFPGEYGSELSYEQLGLAGTRAFGEAHTDCMRTIGATAAARALEN